MLKSSTTMRPWVLIGSMTVLTLLWIPGIFYYAPFADTAIYALLGESMWTRGTYELFGVSNAKYLPLHAFISYPFTQLFGYHIGMQIMSFFAGLGVLLMTYVVTQRFFSERVALLAVVLMTVHHGVVLTTMQGGADLLFTLLFLLSLETYMRAEKKARCYILTGILLGLLCLTRYNGIPIFGFFVLHALFIRHAWKKQEFLFGSLLGILITGTWFIRNFVTFGNPLYTEYTAEVSARTTSIIGQFFTNLVYYADPLHNILPLFFLFALIGLGFRWRSHGFLILAMLAAWSLSGIWWVHAARFLIPGLPLLFAFAADGFFTITKYVRPKNLFIIVIFVAAAFMHGSMLCIYSYGACNAFVDRHIGIIPPYLGLTPEGLYSWTLARRYVNANMEEGKTLLVDAPEEAATWQGTMFRPDIHVTADKSEVTCWYDQITLKPEEFSQVLYRTDTEPVTYVTTIPCL